MCKKLFALSVSPKPYFVTLVSRRQVTGGCLLHGWWLRNFGLAAGGCKTYFQKLASTSWRLQISDTVAAMQEAAQHLLQILMWTIPN